MKLFQAASIMLVATSSSVQAAYEASNNVILAGLMSDPSTIMPKVFDFLVDISCEHHVQAHILSGGDIDAFQTKYRSVADTRYPGTKCASFEIHKDEERINRVPKSREYQRTIIRNKLEEFDDLDSTVILLADLDRGELPSSYKVMKHALDMKSGDLEVDALCSNGEVGYGDEAGRYYDTFATVLLPDTFVYPTEERLYPQVWPDEDSSLILSNEFTNADLFKWFQDQGKGEEGDEGHQMDPVPVRSCFGGLALFRASKFLEQRCSYTIGVQAVHDNKYKNLENMEVSEHVLWNNCMRLLDPDFVIAVQPDMTTVFKNKMMHANKWIKWIRSAAEEEAFVPFSSTSTPTTVPSSVPSSVPTPAPVPKPVKKKTDEPTDSPTEAPTDSPTDSPTAESDKIITIDTSAADDSSRVFSWTAYAGVKAGKPVGLRPKEDKNFQQAFQLDEEGQLRFVTDKTKCVDIDLEANGLYVEDCKQGGGRRLQGVATWSITSNSVIATVGGEKKAVAMDPNDRYGALIAVAPGSPLALDFDIGNNGIRTTDSPTAAPTFEGQTGAPTTFFSQTFEIQSTFKFDDSARSWCLQAINIRSNANLNMRPCEGRKKQQWEFTEDGKIRLKEAPTYCIANVQGKILKLGYCTNGTDGTDPGGEDRNISTFAYDEGELTVTNIRDDTFYFGFNTETKYEPIRLQKDGVSESQSSWKLNAV